MTSTIAAKFNIVEKIAGQGVHLIVRSLHRPIGQEVTRLVLLHWYIFHRNERNNRRY